MTKTFAWILFLSSVACFVLQFRTQQLAVAAERLRQEIDQPLPEHDWQTVEAGTDEIADGVEF